MRKLLFVAGIAAALGGCQALVGANGQVTGFTVPAGCKGQAMFSYPMPQGSIMVQCDETGAPPASASGRAFAAVPVAPGGAHVTIDRR